MDKIRIKELAKYCDSINIDCYRCEKKDACYNLACRLEGLSPIGIVELVDSDEEITDGC